MKTLTTHFPSNGRLHPYTSADAPNTLTEAEAKLLARRHGLTLDDVRADYAQANEYGQENSLIQPFTCGRAELNAHVGRYHCAAYLFESYCRQVSYETRAEARDYARYEEAAFGSPDRL